MSYHDIITIEPDNRGGKPCIRRMRITASRQELINGMENCWKSKGQKR